MAIETISLIIGLGITAVAAIFSIYDRFTKPDIKAAVDIDVLKEGCQLKHRGLDKEIVEINNRFDRMEKNHINHIETDLRSMNITQTKILTILEAKYQIKID
jgi:hypothetical protein